MKLLSSSETAVKNFLNDILLNRYSHIQFTPLIKHHENEYATTFQCFESTAEVSIKIYDMNDEAIAACLTPEDIECLNEHKEVDLAELSIAMKTDDNEVILFDFKEE